MTKRELTVDEIMAILPETSPRISVLTDGLTPAQLHTPPEPDAWSINDVLAHLRACHDVLGGSVLRIARPCTILTTASTCTASSRRRCRARS